MPSILSSDVLTPRQLAFVAERLPKAVFIIAVRCAL
jgi:hypothetical protein